MDPSFIEPAEWPKNARYRYANWYTILYIYWHLMSRMG